MRKLVKSGLAAVGLALAFAVTSTSAAPPGLRGPEIGKKLFNFNVLVFPGEDYSGDDAVCDNEGHRIFFNESNGSLGTITWNLVPGNNPDFDITDCDGTADNDANIVVNESLKLWVAVRLVGPQNSSLDLTCIDVVDAGVNDDLCLIATETIHKGSSFTKIMRNVVDNALEEVTWTLDNSNNAKNLQVWIMEDLS